MSKTANMWAFNASQRQFIHSFTFFFFSRSLWWVFLRPKVLLRNINTQTEIQTVTKQHWKWKLKKCFDILLENQKNKRKIKCFIFHWLWHENMITLILCWGEEKNKSKFARVSKLLLILHLLSHLWPKISKQTAWNSQKNPVTIA